MRQTAFFVLLLACTSIQATTINVPGDSATIQSAIDGAIDYDTVLVAPGVYSGAGNESISFLGKKITVISESGSENTTLLATDTFRTVVFENGETDSSILDGFTISGGYEENFDWSYAQRGGIIIDSASPTVRNCIISGCYADQGGGILVTAKSSPTVYNCKVNNNYAENGGGIHCEGDSVEIIGTEITNNSINGLIGGGISLFSSTARIDSCLIGQNRVPLGQLAIDPPGLGGGVGIIGGNVRIDNSHIVQNSAGLGGAIVAIDNTLETSGSLFYNNTAIDHAGIAIFLPGAPDNYGVTVSHCTFACNYSVNPGSDGLAFTDGSSLTESFQRLNVRSGESEIAHGVADGIFSIKNNIFAFNTYAAIGLFRGAISLEVSHNNVWNTVAGPDYTGLLTDQTGQNSNIMADPLFCEVSTNGFTLDLSSPCVGSGDDGGDQGAFGIGCDFYVGGKPKCITVLPGDNFFETRDSITTALANANPWDTVLFAASDFQFNGDNLIINRSIYLMGQGQDSTRLMSWAGASDSVNSCLDLRAFCVLVKLELVAFQGSSLTNSAAAVNCVENSSIIFDCAVGSGDLRNNTYKAAILCDKSSPLIRNCHFIDPTNWSVINMDSLDIVAAWNFWQSSSPSTIDDLFVIDGNDYPGRGIVIFQPLLDDIPTYIEDEVHATVPSDFVLFQNYPNPFNPTTTVSFSLKRRAEITVSIFNSLGQVVRRWDLGLLSAGLHSLRWNGVDSAGRSVSSGVYFSQLTASGTRISKKMILIR